MTANIRSMRLQCALALVLLVIGAFGASALLRAETGAEGEIATLDMANRPVTIVRGTCLEPGEPAWPLNELAAPEGDAWGNTDSDRTQYSFTANVPFTVAAMLAEPFAILIFKSAGETDKVIACGNIGGITDQIGTLVVGIRPAPNLQLAGVAVLSPNASDMSRSLVSAFLTGGSLGAYYGLGGPPPTRTDYGVPNPTLAPPVATEPPFGDPTEPPVEPTMDDDGDSEEDGPEDEEPEDESDADNSGHDEGEDDSGPGGD